MSETFEEKYKDFKQIPLNQSFNYPPGEIRYIDYTRKYCPNWALPILKKEPRLWQLKADNETMNNQIKLKNIMLKMNQNGIPEESTDTPKKTKRDWKSALPDKNRFPDQIIGKQPSFEETFGLPKEEVPEESTEEETEETLLEGTPAEETIPEETTETLEETEDEKMAKEVPDWDLLSDSERWMARNILELKEKKKDKPNWLDKRIETVLSESPVKEGPVEETVPMKEFTTKAEERAAFEKAKLEMIGEQKRKAELKKQEAFMKSLPSQKPSPDSEIWERVRWLEKTGEQLGEFDQESAVEIFLETGRSVAPLPRSILTLTAEQAAHLRNVNGQSYNNWVRRGGRIQGEGETGPYLREL